MTYLIIPTLFLEANHRRFAVLLTDKSEENALISTIFFIRKICVYFSCTSKSVVSPVSEVPLEGHQITGWGVKIYRWMVMIIMTEYQLEVKQLVDYPRCRIYRKFIQELIADRSIRTNGSSDLFHYTVLCSYVNFRTSYRCLDGISYTVFPGDWICRISELMNCLRLRSRRQVLQALESLQERGYIQYALLGRGHIVKYRIKGWRRHNTILDYNCPCQKETGFFFLPTAVATELVSAKKCSEMDIVLDLWISAVYNDSRV